MKAVLEFDAPQCCSECILWRNYLMCAYMLKYDDGKPVDNKPLYPLKERASYCPLKIVPEKAE